VITRLVNPGNVIIDNVIIDIVAAIKSMRDVLSSVSPHKAANDGRIGVLSCVRGLVRRNVSGTDVLRADMSS
jgi:hypothetical protein